MRYLFLVLGFITLIVLLFFAPAKHGNPGEIIYEIGHTRDYIIRGVAVLSLFLIAIFIQKEEAKWK